MELLQQRILTDGRALNDQVLLVDSFLNHQVDVKLMKACGEEFARRFADAGVTRISATDVFGLVTLSRSPGTRLVKLEVLPRVREAEPLALRVWAFSASGSGVNIQAKGVIVI